MDVTNKGLTLPIRRPRRRDKMVITVPTAANMTIVAKLLRDKRMESVIDRVYSFPEEWEDAVKHVEGGRTKGKVVMVMKAEQRI